MDDAGLALLRSIEALMQQLVVEQKRQADVSEELTALKATVAKSKAKAAARTAKSAAKRQADVSTASIKALDLPREKKVLKSLPENVSKTSGHAELIAHFAEAVQRVSGVKYQFSAEDGKHAKTLAQRFGLDEARRVIDLASVRFQREPFYRNVGLTLRLVANDANKLRTANGKPNGEIAPLWKKQGFGSPEDYARHLDGLAPDPPLISEVKA